MEKKWATLVVILLIFIFISYMVVDVALREKSNEVQSGNDTVYYAEQWQISHLVDQKNGRLKSVAARDDGYYILGGDSFVSLFSPDNIQKWSVKTDEPVTALSVYGDKILATTQEKILLYDLSGKLASEWGPFADSSLITSVSCNKNHIAFADAGTKSVYILSWEGIIERIVGADAGTFIIPSPYFDVALAAEDIIYVANTGNHRIETRDIEGTLIKSIGEPGIEPEAFCGCCNPAHFALIPGGGFITAEKGLNRIKLVDQNGKFIEFISVKNNFAPPQPLDLSTSDGTTIYAANPADSRLYIYKRKPL